MTQRRFYAHPYANSAMRAQIALDEKGLDYEYVACNLLEAAHREASYLALNRQGLVPTLQNGVTGLRYSPSVPGGDDYGVLAQ